MSVAHSFFDRAPQTGLPVRRIPAATEALGDRERQFMTALGAYHLRYARTHEALALLQLVNRLWPNDPNALRLLTQAFLQIGDHDAAEMTDRAYQACQPEQRQGDLLRRAAIWLGLGQLSRAYATLTSAISNASRR
jgi:Flp pilus assembly protein TadD